MEKRKRIVVVSRWVSVRDMMGVRNRVTGRDMRIVGGRCMKKMGMMVQNRKIFEQQMLQVVEVEEITGGKRIFGEKKIFGEKRKVEVMQKVVGKREDILIVGQVAGRFVGNKKVERNKRVERKRFVEKIVAGKIGGGS
jgi:hypothetical protein